MKTTVPSKVTMQIAAAIKVLESRGYIRVPRNRSKGTWKETLANLLKNELEHKYGDVEFAPSKWPDIKKYPDINPGKKPYPGLLFRIMVERWVKGPGSPFYQNFQMKHLIKTKQAKKEDFKVWWKVIIYEFPLFSNESSILRPDGHNTSVTDAASYITRQEKRMKKFLAKQKS